MADMADLKHRVVRSRVSESAKSSRPALSDEQLQLKQQLERSFEVIDSSPAGSVSLLTGIPLEDLRRVGLC